MPREVEEGSQDSIGSMGISGVDVSSATLSPLGECAILIPKCFS
jgi:hypothetical protein